MQVVLRDPRHRKAGGRTPYRQPYTDPGTVVEIHGEEEEEQSPTQGFGELREPVEGGDCNGEAILAAGALTPVILGCEARLAVGRGVPP